MKITNPVLALIFKIIMGRLSWVLHIVLAGSTLALAVWGLQQLFPLTIFEACILCIAVWGVVILNAIHSKVSSIENMVEYDEWNDDYDFYSEEGEEPLVKQEKNVDSETECSRGKVISLEQRMFSKKQDKQ
ncbi:MAG: hypothetical protein HQM14_17605 [SAR324 cluster bacterium]|nr:hypothetical protein [SAR324 cluster bacterium]